MAGLPNLAALWRTRARPIADRLQPRPTVSPRAIGSNDESKSALNVGDLHVGVRPSAAMPVLGLLARHGNAVGQDENSHQSEIGAEGAQDQAGQQEPQIVRHRAAGRGVAGLDHQRDADDQQPRARQGHDRPEGAAELPLQDDGRHYSSGARQKVEL